MSGDSIRRPAGRAPAGDDAARTWFACSVALPLLLVAWPLLLVRGIFLERRAAGSEGCRQPARSPIPVGGVVAGLSDERTSGGPVTATHPGPTNPGPTGPSSPPPPRTQPIPVPVPPTGPCTEPPTASRAGMHAGPR